MNIRELLSKFAKPKTSTPFSTPKEYQEIRNRQQTDALIYFSFCEGILNYPAINAYEKMGLKTLAEKNSLTVKFMHQLCNVMTQPDPENGELDITKEEKSVIRRINSANGFFPLVAINSSNYRQIQTIDYTAHMIAINFVRGMRTKGEIGLFAKELSTSLDAYRQKPEALQPLSDAYNPDEATIKAIDWAIGIYLKDMGLSSQL